MTRYPIRPNMSIDTEVGDGPFVSPAALRGAFEERLGRLLQHDVLGVFILVLANASHEPGVFERLRAPLAAAFERWCERFDRGDARAQEAAPDDRAVFQRLRAFGLDALSETRWRRVGPWEAQFNPLRALRPPRSSDRRVTELRRPFDPAGFHFNRAFLRPEIFWEGELGGSCMRLLYNKFPFAELHGLLVPDPEAGRPQFLEREDHERIWAVAARLGGTLPGIGFGYNAYGAHASVNHLHFQLFLRSAGGYPIESAVWRHNGGDRPYPLPVQRHDDGATAWSAVQWLHTVGITYNLLYRPGCVYIAPRAMQGSHRHAAWTAGFAWSEIAGVMTLTDATAFSGLTADAIEQEFIPLAVRP